MTRGAALHDGPLNAQELDRLRAFLGGIHNGKALSLEGLDGLFCALIAGPELVMPSEYLPAIWGGELPDENAFESAEAANEIITLMMRHWNAIIAELEEHKVYVMLAGDPDEHGLIGRAWALGFMRGVAMRKRSWAALFADENEGQLGTIPLVAGLLDPNFPSAPVPPETAEQLLSLIGAGLGRAYRHFKELRRAARPDSPAPPPVRRANPKVGRNEPCPCGSGKKFKHCCGVALH